MIKFPIEEEIVIGAIGSDVPFNDMRLSQSLVMDLEEILEERKRYLKENTDLKNLIEDLKKNQESM